MTDRTVPRGEDGEGGERFRVAYRDDGRAELVIAPAGMPLVVGLATEEANRILRDEGRFTSAARELARALKRCIQANREAQMSASGRESGRQSGAHAGWLSSAEAAELLDVSPRTVRRRADQFGGRRVGRDWQFPAAAVAEATDTEVNR